MHKCIDPKVQPNMEALMISTPEQFVQLPKSALDSFQAAALASMEGIEKLAELNMQAARASIDESTEVVKSLIEAKDVKAFADLASTGAQPAAEKFAAYAKHVFEITSATNAELVKLVEKQFADSNKQLYSAIDAMAKNAPAGSEGVVNMVKQAVSSANTAFDQVSKATKQVVELAEANMAAAAKSSPVRAATKKAA
jgi:phasin family protein